MGVRCDLFCMRSWEKQNVIGLCVVAFSLAALDLAPLDLSLVGVSGKLGCPVLCVLPTVVWQCLPTDWPPNYIMLVTIAAQTNSVMQL